MDIPPIQYEQPAQNLQVQRALLLDENRGGFANEALAMPKQLRLFLAQSLIVASDIQEIYQNPESTPEEIIDTLSLDPTLEEAFDFFSGTAEKFRISEHSRMVIETEAKYRLFDRITSCCPATREEFRLFLALHDIGKGYAVQEYTRGAERKKAELFFNRIIIAKALLALDLKLEVISLFLSMQQLDTLGEYLKGYITLDQAELQIRNQSKTAGLPSADYLKIYETYFLSDAGSYPELQETIFREKNGTLVHQKENQNKMNALYQRLS